MTDSIFEVIKQKGMTQFPKVGGWEAWLQKADEEEQTERKSGTLMPPSLGYLSFLLSPMFALLTQPEHGAALSSFMML